MVLSESPCSSSVYCMVFETENCCYVRHPTDTARDICAERRTTPDKKRWLRYVRGYPTPDNLGKRVILTDWAPHPGLSETVEEAQKLYAQSMEDPSLSAICNSLLDLVKDLHKEVQHLRARTDELGSQVEQIYRNTHLPATSRW